MPNSQSSKSEFSKIIFLDEIMFTFHLWIFTKPNLVNYFDDESFLGEDNFIFIRGIEFGKFDTSNEKDQFVETRPQISNAVEKARCSFIRGGRSKRRIFG